MKRRNIATALLVAGLAIGMTSLAAEKQEAPKKKQTHCAVMRQNPINTNLYVDVRGKRIYVCCPGCIGKIKADPDKYIKQMEADGMTLENAPVMQKTCPVSDKPINKNLYVDADGYRIYTCCPNCIGAVKADPEKYIKKMKAEGITLEKTPKKEMPDATGKSDK